MSEEPAMECRPRNYRAEDEAYSLPRVPAHSHPLSAPSTPHYQIDVHQEKNEFSDPLRAPDTNAAVCFENPQVVEYSSIVGSSTKHAIQNPEKEWTSFKKFLMQRFSVSNMVSISSMSAVLIKGSKVYKNSSRTDLEEPKDSEKYSEESVKVISRQDYISRLHELKDEITRAWKADDRVTSLKLSIKVARLLMDTSVLQFYPTLFVLAMDVMDMLGGMVWERIKSKAELAEDGTFRCSLPEDFGASDISFDAKETCSNWFFKIGSVQELLPRIYLELAILPCWRFLHDHPVDCLQRLVMMIRGIADPLASAYCRLYLAYCAQRIPQCDTGYLISCINDLKVIVMRVISVKEETKQDNCRRNRLLVSLMEPTIEYIMQCIFKNSYQTRLGNVLAELGLRRNQSEFSGRVPCVSIILYHLLKEFPTELIASYAVDIVQLIECSNDFSFDQCLIYRLLGFRLSERRLQVDVVNAVVAEVIQVVTQFKSLDEFLKVVDAYVDIVLQNHMDDYLNIILDGIINRVCSGDMAESEMTSLESILIKLLTHFNNLDDILSLNYFTEILDLMHGNSRGVISIHILNIAARKGCIRDPTTTQFLFEVCRALHDDSDFSKLREDDNQQPTRLISGFVNMVDYGAELERHLTFLVECRGAFGGINELKETLVHSCNCLAVKAMKDAPNYLSFVKSCIAFSEVTIPSISERVKQLNLFLETAEVALSCGLVGHSDGLIDSAISCLQSLDSKDGLRQPNDADGIISSTQKLCSLLVMVPGNSEQGVTYISKSILSLVNFHSWMTPKMKTRVLCAIISLSATLSQNKLPYCAIHDEVLSNDLIFFGEPTYLQELQTFSASVIHNLVDHISQEPSQAARGTMALEACNCIVSSLKPSHEVQSICSELMDIAKSCLKSNDKYLQSTLRFISKHLQTSQVAETSIASGQTHEGLGNVNMIVA